MYSNALMYWHLTGRRCDPKCLTKMMGAKGGRMLFCLGRHRRRRHLQRSKFARNSRANLIDRRLECRIPVNRNSDPPVVRKYGHSNTVVAGDWNDARVCLQGLPGDLERALRSRHIGNHRSRLRAEWRNCNACEPSRHIPEKGGKAHRDHRLWRFFQSVHAALDHKRAANGVRLRERERAPHGDRVVAHGDGRALSVQPPPHVERDHACGVGSHIRRTLRPCNGTGNTRQQDIIHRNADVFPDLLYFREINRCGPCDALFRRRSLLGHKRRSRLHVDECHLDADHNRRKRPKDGHERIVNDRKDSTKKSPEDPDERRQHSVGRTCGRLDLSRVRVAMRGR
eukprot:Opistho-2@70212